MPGIKIVSDFTDYYDYLSDSLSTIEYSRKANNGVQRVAALNKLRQLGIKAIDIMPVNKYISSDGKIVVYTNTSAHDGKGKKVLTVDEAKLYYSNYSASKYYENCKDYIKFIQIGKQRYTLNINRSSVEDRHSEEIKGITKLPDEYNRVVGIPIFSIDYICIENQMVATDFNEVEKLSNYGIQSFIKPEEVIKEIKDSLLIYNLA